METHETATKLFHVARLVSAYHSQETRLHCFSRLYVSSPALSYFAPSSVSSVRSTRKTRFHETESRVHEKVGVSWYIDLKGLTNLDRFVLASLSNEPRRSTNQEKSIPHTTVSCYSVARYTWPAISSSQVVTCVHRHQRVPPPVCFGADVRGCKAAMSKLPTSHYVVVHLA